MDFAVGVFCSFSFLIVIFLVFKFVFYPLLLLCEPIDERIKDEN